MTDTSHATPGQEQLQAFLDDRLARLNIEATTTTPSGQTLDWVRPGSQLAGGSLASPPPEPPSVAAGSMGAGAIPATSELDDPAVARGPNGTVPLLRPTIEHMTQGVALTDLLKKKTANPGLAREAKLGAGVDYAGHHYGNSGSTMTCWGGQGTLSVFVPTVAAYGDFSLIQIGLVNSELGYMQSVEAGWVVDPQVNGGDYGAHLFLYYTTNGYAGDGDNAGGWNTLTKGWVQYDANWYPGMTFSPTSVPGGSQYEITIKYQLYQGNWWFNVQNRWLGYYPGSLYTGNNAASTMADHAGSIGFWGEVYDAANPPTTQMGSGHFCSEGWTWAAYMHNLLTQTDSGGGMGDYNGWTNATDPNSYTICPFFSSGSNWGSYLYVGGPGGA